MTTHSALIRATVCVFAFLAGLSAHGQRRWDAPSIVTTNCSGCHGIDGSAELSYFPRLAGLDAAYAETKMAEFKEIPSPPSDELYGWIRSLSRKRPQADPTRNEVINMVGIAHSAKPEELRQANLWYANQRPSPGRKGEATLIHQGQELYTKGVPDKNILPCLSCHGEDAQGQGTTPRLAGQNTKYFEAQMEKFRNGGDAVMSPQARDVTPQQAHAMAVYLESR
jgi:cytochrome c553